MLGAVGVDAPTFILLFAGGVGHHALQQLDEQQEYQPGEQDSHCLGLCRLCLGKAAVGGTLDIRGQCREPVDIGLIAGLCRAVAHILGAVGLQGGPFREIGAGITPSPSPDLHPGHRFKQQEGPEHAPYGARGGPEWPKDRSPDMKGDGQPPGRIVDLVKGRHISGTIWARVDVDGLVKCYAVDLDIRGRGDFLFCTGVGHTCLPPWMPRNRRALSTTPTSWPFSVMMIGA